ncbi:MAG TPA: hypothetical protein VGF71_13275 [Caulobacteraceae bacterium]|jgi:hypothetical protein
MSLFNPKTASASVRQQLIDAKAGQVAAEANLNAAYVSGDEAAETLSTAKLNEARRAVARLEAILIDADRREQAAAAKARKAKDRADDAKVRDAYRAQTNAATDFEKAVGGYVSAYADLIAAGDTARAVAGPNPRVRTDLREPNIAALASNEIARQADVEDRLLPPGASWPTASRDPKSVMPLADQFGDLAAAILPTP